MKKILYIVCLWFVPLLALANPFMLEEQVDTVLAKRKHSFVSVVKDSSLVLKSNILYDIMLFPSAEVEYRISARWSVLVDFSIAWWKNTDKHKFYQLMQIGPEARFWLNPKRGWHGHYIGAFVSGGHYDLSAGWNGYKGEFVMGGLSYGYMFPIDRMFSFDVGLGIGYMYTEYEEYLPLHGHYVYQQTSRMEYIGPLKVKLSLVWHIGRGKKGGNR